MSTNSPKRAAAERAGRRAELAAAFILTLKGFRVIARRYRTPQGEIDLIALRRWPFRRSKPLLVFAEVKKRRTREEAAESVQLRQQNRIERAAGAFLAANPPLNGAVMRFDVFVAGRGFWPRHITNAWQPG